MRFFDSLEELLVFNTEAIQGLIPSKLLDHLLGSILHVGIHGLVVCSVLVPPAIEGFADSGEPMPFLSNMI